MKVKDYIEFLQTLDEERELTVLTPVYNSDSTDIVSNDIMIDAIDNPFVSNSITPKKYNKCSKGQQIKGYLEEREDEKLGKYYCINVLTY